MGQKHYATTNTDTALTDDEIRGFSAFSAKCLPLRAVMLLHMPVSMATEWQGLLREEWKMQQVPITFIKVSRFVKFTSLANGELSGNTDFFWIFTRLLNKAGPSLCFNDVMKMKTVVGWKPEFESFADFMMESYKYEKENQLILE